MVFRWGAAPQCCRKLYQTIGANLGTVMKSVIRFSKSWLLFFRTGLIYTFHCHTKFRNIMGYPVPSVVFQGWFSNWNNQRNSYERLSEIASFVRFGKISPISGFYTQHPIFLEPRLGIFLTLFFCHANIARNAFRHIRLMRPSKLNSDINTPMLFSPCSPLQY